jgi:hypothetical protein
VFSGDHKNTEIDMTVFIAGSISIKRLSRAATQRLDSIIAKGHEIVVGDAGGVDKAVQRHLNERQYDGVTVYCINSPRNNLGNWPVETVATTEKRPKRSDFATKDRAMAERADAGFMIWDDRSPGTLNNVLNLLSSGKPSLVYIYNADEFLWITGREELGALVDRIPPEEREKTDEKIGLFERMRDLGSAGAYETESVNQRVRESQLDLFGSGAAGPFLGEDK